MRVTLRGAVFILLVGTLSVAGILNSGPKAKASSGPIAYLSYEDSSWKSDTSCCRWLYDPWNNNTFRVATQGYPDYLHSWISASIANEGQKSLGVELKTPPPPTIFPWQSDPKYEKQRIEFEISNGDYYTQHLEESRYYGVAIYIHPQSDNVLKKGAIFMQAWQSHDTTYSKHPPFSLRFKDGSAYQWEVHVSHDTKTDTRYTTGTDETIYTSPTGLTKGAWHEFIVWFKPSVQSQGAVRVWHNGTLAVGQTNQRNFGYVPQSTFPIMNNSFAVRFGLYRQPEPDLPTHIILMFDQAKFGTSYESVDP